MCPPAVTPVNPVAVDESLADVAKVAVAVVKEAEPDAVATTAEAAAAAVIAPSVELLVPLPRGNLSRRSGTLKVVVPFPAP